MEILWKNSIDELKKSNFNSKDKIYFECSKCHRTQMLYYKTVINKDYFICRACRGIETQLSLKEKDPNYGWFKFSKDADWMTSDEFLKKRKNTMLEKYDVKYTTQSEELRKKIKKTLEEKLGENYNEIIQENREKNNLEKYGIRIAGLQDKESKEKAKKTCLERYGYEYTAQVPKIREKQALSNHKKWKIKLNNKIICFDSKPEIYYYFWLLDNNIEFEYNKKYHKQYESNNKKHSYYYDFHLLKSNEYIELKGDCFFNKNNEPTGAALFGNYNWTDKFNFLVKENVKIIKTSRIENGDLKFIKENFLKKHKDVEVYK